MTAQGQDPAAIIDFILASKSLKVDAEERERLIRTYPAMQAMVDALRLPEVRYGEPT